MNQATIDDIELVYELRGDGEPVVLVHWGVGTAWAGPLLDAPALAGHRLLSYDRAGFGRSGRAPGGVSMADHAAHCVALMRRLGIERAHVVGHSSSAAIALQLAHDAPEAVQTLVLLEPARPAPQTAIQARFTEEVVLPAVGHYRAGDVRAAVETWCRGVFGGNYPAAVLEDAVADADAFFTQELPALQAWTFGPDEGGRVTPPTLVVVGGDSVPTFAERRELLLSWLPAGEPLDLAGLNHLLHLQDADPVAAAAAGFIGRHPI
jgi:pimeloyl-ACP methyl ester carboxylesterase